MNTAVSVSQEMVLPKTAEILADLLCLQTSEIKPWSRLEADLGFGVVEGVRAVMGQIDGFVFQRELEQEFGILFADDYYSRLPEANVQEIADDVIALLHQQEA